MVTLLIAFLQLQPVWVGKFNGSGAMPAPWHTVKVGKARATEYRLAKVANQPAMEAVVNRSMSLLVRPITVDLTKTPILCWSWFVDGTVAKADMRTKSGNDFAARIYVGFDMPDSALDVVTKMKLSIARRMFDATLPDAALTYVWDNRNPVGTSIKSPFTSRQQLIVAESGENRARRWVTERADVAKDFARAFGGKPGRPVQLAVASDGDNTKSSGRAAFANIYFVPRNQQCVT